MAQYNTVFHILAKILPRHEIDRLDRKYSQGDRRRKTSRYVQLMTKVDGEREDVEKTLCVMKQSS